MGVLDVRFMSIEKLGKGSAGGLVALGRSRKSSNGPVVAAYKL